MRIATKVIHAGMPHPRIEGAVSMPVFQSSTFEYGGPAEYHDIRYIRLNNTPNHLAVHQKLAAIENAEAAVVTSSGMSAIATTLLTVLKAGDHLLIQDCLYGGTFDLVTKDLPDYAIEFDFIDNNDPDSWRDLLRPNTKAIYVETIANPLLQICDLEAVVEFAKTNALVSIIDNTFASPINFRPIDLGFDLSLHSCTKYLNGHSDIVGGAIIGREDLVFATRKFLNHLGGCMDPHVIYLLERGMKTLSLRMKAHNENALALAKFLSRHPAVGRVNYPGLPTHPQFERASRLFLGSGGVLSFELKVSGSEIADQLISSLELAACAPSLGGVETLATRPATTSHVGMSPEDRRLVGISDELIRLSVGIEDYADLIDDFEQGLSRISASAKDPVCL